MGDSFADLWNSSAPVKPSEPARKLGASPAPVSRALHPKYDAFAMLAASSPNSSSPRSLTPSSKPPVPGQRSNSGGAAAATSGDAFDDLLSGSFGNDSSNAKLTMAEKVAKAKTQGTHQQPATSLYNTTAWAGLDSLAGASSSSSSQTFKSTSSGLDDDWLFGSSTNFAQAESAPTSKLSTHDWGLDDFVSPPKSSSEAPGVLSSQGKSLWDLDDFKSSSKGDQGDTSSAQTFPPPIPILPATLILVTDVAPAYRKPSPPPHLIGQIVEMGFSPNQAREALASTATESGLDVQAALETLLSDASRSPSTPAERPASRGWQSERDRFPDHDGWGDERHDSGSSRPWHLHQPRPSQEQTVPSSSETSYQLQADKIVTQASEIGSQLFQRANAFWKEGKTRVQKAYEERTANSRAGTTASSEGQSGKPRWMREDPGHSQPIQQPKERSRTSFRDEETGTPSDPPMRIKRPQAKSSPPNQTKTGDLFGEDIPIAYVSPFRRGVDSHTAPLPSSVPTHTGPLRAPSPVRLSERRVTSASLSAISASSQHKASGTEMFKLGRFAEAETAYTSAISQLPDSHLLLVPLLNNRALSRIKIGNMSGAIEDCSTVIAIVGPSYHPEREAKVQKEEDGAGIDLSDGLTKAWRRRAEAYEGKEKWDLARQDWESIAGADFAGRHRNEALSGIGRCRRILNVGNASDGAAPYVSRPTRPTTRPPPRRGPTPPSEALTRLKQANQEAEADEQARLELKDSVDSRLAAWKNGKETNLRALVASLDTVLWPELGWQKVGMAELVTPNQVKIRYTKAIAKLHPDKLNVRNTTLEQRMIANSVFGALNEAWNAFKP
ncbi:hypothetical protein BJV74DRAFT_884270 [Russula compacta]|nr:hypothetical protein BJV74DRAFT_884270 [Russula compacta]